MLAAHARSVSGMAAFCNETFNLSGRGEPEQVLGARVSSAFFDVLGIRPLMGRSFRPEEDKPGGGDVVMVSYEFWTRVLHASRDALGQAIALDSRSHTLIGVLPPGFTFALLGTKADVWAPRVYELSIATPPQIRAGAGFLSAVARLAPGVSRTAALAEINGVDQQYKKETPGRVDTDPRLSVAVDDLQGQMVANVRTAVLLLAGAVGLVLLIACANVASLLLSRSLARRKEIALRGALGAGRNRLVRQLLTENVVLAAAGGAAGILLGYWGTAALEALGRTALPQMGPLHMDLRVLAFTLVVSLVSGIIFGLAPALDLSRPDLNTVLREESRRTSGSRGGAHARGALVVGQVALSMMLLVGFGLLVRSFYELRAVSPGFDPSHVLTMRITLPPTRYPTPVKINAFADEVLRRARTLPGVVSVAISSAQPSAPTRFTPVLLEGQPQVPLGQRPVRVIEMISPEWCSTLRVPLLRGREFTPHDDAQSQPVVMVNQALARRYWPNENAVGKKVYLGYIAPPFEVVGVVGNVKNVSLAADSQPEVLMALPQKPWAILNLMVRTAGEPLTMTGAVRREIAAIDPEQPVTGIQSMDDLLDNGRNQTRFTVYLLGGFAVAALALALVGIYGAIAYSVAQRAPELGIRLALGAARADIFRIAIGQGLVLALLGVVVGIGGALALTRYISTLLYATSSTDPLIFVGSALLFATAALAAGYIPARRAMRIDPCDALRSQ
jgi:predicted permease